MRGAGAASAAAAPPQHSSGIWAGDEGTHISRTGRSLHHKVSVRTRLSAGVLLPVCRMSQAGGGSEDTALLQNLLSIVSKQSHLRPRPTTTLIALLLELACNAEQMAKIEGQKDAETQTEKNELRSKRDKRNKKKIKRLKDCKIKKQKKHERSEEKQTTDEDDLQTIFKLDDEGEDQETATDTKQVDENDSGFDGSTIESAAQQSAHSSSQDGKNFSEFPSEEQVTSPRSAEEQPETEPQEVSESIIQEQTEADLKVKTNCNVNSLTESVVGRRTARSESLSSGSSFVYSCSRSRSPSIRVRRCSPSWVCSRRITSARRLPVPYCRPASAERLAAMARARSRARQRRREERRRRHRAQHRRSRSSTRSRSRSYSNTSWRRSSRKYNRSISRSSRSKSRRYRSMSPSRSPSRRNTSGSCRSRDKSRSSHRRHNRQGRRSWDSRSRSWSRFGH